MWYKDILMPVVVRTNMTDVCVCVCVCSNHQFGELFWLEVCCTDDVCVLCTQALHRGVHYGASNCQCGSVQQRLATFFFTPVRILGGTAAIFVFGDAVFLQRNVHLRWMVS